MHLSHDSCVSPPRRGARAPRVPFLHAAPPRRALRHSRALPAAPPRGNPRFRPDKRLSPCVPRCVPSSRVVSASRAVPLLRGRSKARFSLPRSRSSDFGRAGPLLATQAARPGSRPYLASPRAITQYFGHPSTVQSRAAVQHNNFHDSLRPARRKVWLFLSWWGATFLCVI